MKNLIIIAFVFLSVFTKGYSQQSLSDYKYLVIPEQFEFVKGKDKYRLNTLTRYLFKQHGFNAVYDSELPNDVQRCELLWADATGNSGLVYTKVKYIIRDCNGFIVLESREGKSKDKEYKVAYQEAVRDAFKSIEMIVLKDRENAVKKPSKPVSAKDVTSVVPDPPKVTPPISSTTPEEIKDAPVVKPMGHTASELKPRFKRYFFEAYEIWEKENGMVVMFQGQNIGKLVPTSRDDNYLVETSQFSGAAYLKDGFFYVERVVEGLSKPVVMKFKKAE